MAKTLDEYKRWPGLVWLVFVCVLVPGTLVFHSFFYRFICFLRFVFSGEGGGGEGFCSAVCNHRTFLFLPRVNSQDGHWVSLLIPGIQ